MQRCVASVVAMLLQCGRSRRRHRVALSPLRQQRPQSRASQWHPAQHPASRVTWSLAHQQRCRQGADVRSCNQPMVQTARHRFAHERRVCPWSALHKAVAAAAAAAVEQAPGMVARAPRLAKAGRRAALCWALQPRHTLRRRSLQEVCTQAVRGARLHQSRCARGRYAGPSWCEAVQGALAYACSPSASARARALCARSPPRGPAAPYVAA